MQIRFPVFILIHNLFVDKIMIIMRIRCTNFHCGEKAKAMRFNLEITSTYVTTRPNENLIINGSHCSISSHQIFINFYRSCKGAGR